MRKAFLLIISLSLFFCYSCKTDFDINAEPKEITIVYGLLNQADTAQYIKITKAFLGEESAILMAQDPTLSSYGDDLTVKVEQVSNGNVIRAYFLERTWIQNKDTGIFYYPTQEVYKFVPNPAMNSQDSFRLHIQNNISGNVVTSATNLISDFSVSQPAYNPVNPLIGIVTTDGSYGEYEAKWKSAKNGRIFEPLIRFHFKEVNNNTPTDTVYKYIDLRLSSVKSEKLTGGEDLSTTYRGVEFFSKLQSVISVDNDITRFIGKMDFIISVGGDDLSIYMDLNKPSTSIIQERPVYTNISNGLGIFSCRYIKTISYNLHHLTRYELINGPYTSQLNFQ